MIKELPQTDLSYSKSSCRLKQLQQVLCPTKVYLSSHSLNRFLHIYDGNHLIATFSPSLATHLVLRYMSEPFEVFRISIISCHFPNSELRLLICSGEISHLVHVQ